MKTTVVFKDYGNFRKDYGSFDSISPQKTNPRQLPARDWYVCIRPSPQSVVPLLFCYLIYYAVVWVLAPTAGAQFYLSSRLFISVN